MRLGLRWLMTTAAAALVIAGHAAADFTLLYDVDFSTPPHTVGNAPVTGAGPAVRKIPTAVPDGDPTVVVQLGAMTAQPCAFGNGTTGVDLLEFGVGPSHPGGFPVVYDEYWVMMDVAVDLRSSGDLLKLMFDCPTLNDIEFLSFGLIRLFPSGEELGYFTPGVPLAVQVRLNPPNEEWSIWLDGIHVHTGSLNGDQFRSLRINLNSYDVSTTVGIDDLYVYGGELLPTLQLLYDVDFATPPHTVGNLPVLGTGPAPRKTPTDIFAGDPTVVASLGALDEQPCAFGNGTTGYDQLRFYVHPSYPHGFPIAYDYYSLTLETLVQTFDPDDELEIFMDCPTIHVVRFYADGFIRVFPGDQTIGQFSFGQPVDLRIDVDVLSDLWFVWLDGSLAYSGPAAADRLSSFRIHISGTDAANAAAVDDVRLWGWGTSSRIAESEPPDAARVLQAYPNPTAGESRISWEAPGAGPAHVEILTVDGRRVWSRAAHTSHARTGEIRWIGNDSDGHALPSGVYFARVRAGSEPLGWQMIVLRR